MNDMKEITIKIPRSFYDRMVLFVESEYQKAEGEISREQLMESLLVGAVQMIDEYMEDFPPEQPDDLLH
jgi:hypothetical protein